jgi:hypothetical protein
VPPLLALPARESASRLHDDDRIPCAGPRVLSLAAHVL